MEEGEKWREGRVLAGSFEKKVMSGRKKEKSERREGFGAGQTKVEKYLKTEYQQQPVNFLMNGGQQERRKES